MNWVESGKVYIYRGKRLEINGISIKMPSGDVFVSFAFDAEGAVAIGTIPLDKFMDRFREIIK